MSEKGSERFQVDLSGIISVLSKHLYSTPRVAFRELLQNGVDAISARRLLDPNHEGSINFEIIPGDSSPTLVVEDNGIGLTEQEVHQFLATIGGSSKGTEKSRAQDTFIGQFGIGLLSEPRRLRLLLCLLHVHHITLTTERGGFPRHRSARGRSGRLRPCAAKKAGNAAHD